MAGRSRFSTTWRAFSGAARDTHSRRKSSSRKLLDLKDKGRRDHTLTSAILGPRSGVHFIKILRALHDFRSISLHPADPEAVEGGMIRGDEYIKMSARLSQAFEKLELIAQKNEK